MSVHTNEFAAANKWLPIETAPKGCLLLYFPEVRTKGVTLGAMLRIGSVSEFTHRKATHWQPLPEPPKGLTC